MKTKKQATETDAWIVKNVMGSTPDPECKGWWRRKENGKVVNFEQPQFCANYGDTMRLLEFLAMELGTLEVQHVSKNWWCVMHRADKGHYVAGFGNTIQEATCDFTKQFYLQR